MELTKKRVISSATVFFTALALIAHLSVSPLSAGEGSRLFISVDYAAMQSEEDENMLLVDVRSPVEFKRYRIPGSINIPFHFVKTKTHLKQRKIILVNRGFSTRYLVDGANTLNQMGFDAKILQGGLYAWMQSGLAFEGDAFAGKSLSRVSPRQALREHATGSVVPVDITGDTSDRHQLKASRKIFEDTLYLDPTDKDFAERLGRLKTEHPSGAVLFFNQNGTGYEAVRRQIESAGIQAVFFLKGGLSACNTHMDATRRAKAPKSERTISIDQISCNSCND